MRNGFLKIGPQLNHLMESFNPKIKGSKDLCNRMYSSGILVYVPRKGSSHTAISEKTDRDYSCRTIQNHLNNRGADLKWIKAYCDFFGCSADYLFGYISEPTHQKTDINEYTGLSEESIGNLHQISQSDYISDLLEPLNFLLEDAPDGEFGLALHELTGYKQIYMNYLNNAEDSDVKSTEDIQGSNSNDNSPKSVAKKAVKKAMSKGMSTASKATKKAGIVIKANEEEDALMYNVHRHFEESSKNYIQIEKNRIDKTQSKKKSTHD